MSGRHQRWLLGELPTLVADGLLSAEQGEALERRYALPSAAETGRRLALLVFGLLGATLVGLGIILLLAHNWQQLSRPVRAGLALGLLVAAQGLLGWTLWRRPAAEGLREGAAAFQALAIGATLGLVSQTYHLAGDLDRFLLTWLLLALPLVHLASARFTACLYLWGALGWSAAVTPAWSLAFWLLALPLLPLLARAGRPAESSRLGLLLFWSASLSVLLAALVAIARLAAPAAGLLYVAGLLGAMWALASDPRASGRSWRQAVGAPAVTGLAILALVLTFDGAWPTALPQPNGPAGAALLALGALFGLLATAQALALARRQRWISALFAAVPLLVALGLLVAVEVSARAAALAADGLLLALGLLPLATGLRSGRLAETNAGLALLAALIAVRFFDSDLSLVARGAAFVVLGAIFLAVNLRLLRRRPGGAA